MPVSPPRPKMPALNSLRAFEAAARLESFTDAAAELCVTPGAVAQHIKSLEAWTGKKLFKRHPQGIELTALGAGTLTDFIEAFDRLGEAVNKLRANAIAHEIRIAALPSIAQLWLSPRLPEIRAAMPEISISVTALEQRPMLKREPYDLSIFYEEHPVCEKSIVIDADSIFPVCSPKIADDLGSPADLANAVLVHDTAWSDDWKTWLRKVLPEQKLPKSGPAFSLYSLAVEEAKNGAGVLMGHHSLVQSQLASGVLVAPFDDEVKLDRSLTIEIARHSVGNSYLKRVIDRLLKS